jgi:integrase
MRHKTVRRAALFTMLALSTAARAQAIIGLTWDRVDLKRRLIDYRDGSLRATKKRRVPVPIEDRLWPELARAWIEQGRPKSGPVLGSFGELRKSFETLKAGFIGPRGVTLPAGLTRHDLRRTWATLAAQRGVPMFQIAGMLGDTLETVERHYAHHSPEYLRGAVNRDRA